MSDIFISYAREDLETAKLFAEAWQGLGWSVFWDRTIPTGMTWDEVIERELEGAGSVIVLWSKASIRSNFVRDEAADARDRGVLTPVLIENVRLPIGFRRFHALDLSRWDGDHGSPLFLRLTRDLGRLLGLAPATVEGQRRRQAEVEEREAEEARHREEAETKRLEVAEEKCRKAEEDKRQANLPTKQESGTRRRQPSRRQWLPVLLAGGGWFIGMRIAFFVDPTHPVVDVIGGVIGGLMTGLALRSGEPSLKWSHVLFIAIGWAVGFSICLGWVACCFCGQRAWRIDDRARTPARGALTQMGPSAPDRHLLGHHFCWDAVL